MIEQIKANPVYQQILRDSCGGIVYNVANRNKYDTAELMELWNNLMPQEWSSVDGIMKGVFNFLKGA